MDLIEFCDLEHEHLCKPFTHCGYTYASNGYLMVRVPEVADVTTSLPGALKLDKLDFGDPASCLTAIPSYTVKKKKCDACRGTGRVENCPECDGEGVVEFGNAFHEYECDCMTCYGEGVVQGNKRKCCQCDGTGQVYVDRYAYVEIGDVRLSIFLLEKIKTLPNVFLGPTNGDERTQVSFCFDGGQGVLMVQRKDY